MLGMPLCKLYLGIRVVKREPMVIPLANRNQLFVSDDDTYNFLDFPVLFTFSNLLGYQLGKDTTPAQKIALHEAAIRIAHNYLKTLYNPNVYRAEASDALPETDAHTFYAGEAYARKDEGDILGFVRGLRKAVSLNKKMKDIVLLCVNSVSL